MDNKSNITINEMALARQVSDKIDEIAKIKKNYAQSLIWWHSRLQDVLAEVRALDRVVADDLEAVMNQMWEAKDEVRK